MSDYQETAESYLSELLSLKERKASIERDLRLVEHKLSISFSQGDLNHLKTEDKSSSLRFDDVTFIFCAGRESFDYSECKDIKQKETELKTLKKTAASVGLAPKKTGSPYWTVRS